MNASDLINA